MYFADSVTVCYKNCLHDKAFYDTIAMLKRPHGQAVKTPPSHGGYRSSNLLGVTTKNPK